MRGDFTTSIPHLTEAVGGHAAYGCARDGIVNILPDHVELDVDARSVAIRMKQRLRPGMRNDRQHHHATRSSRHRQAHTVDRDAPMEDDVLIEARRMGYPDVPAL